MIVQNVAIAISYLFHSIAPKDENIMIPTIIKADAVTADDTTLKNDGKNNDRKKNLPVKKAVLPERLTDATPADDSR